jgi:uncharacterized protein
MNCFHLRKLALFDSVVCENFGPQNDIDVLVDFEPGHVPGFDFVLMEVKLSKIFCHKVDLQTINFLAAEIQQSVLSEAVSACE